MGGYGSGRPRQRPHLGQLHRLDVQAVWTGAQGVTGRHCGWSDGSSISVIEAQGRLTLLYQLDGVRVERLVSVVQFACHFGGTRPLMRCLQCGKAVRFLYLRSGTFVCRRCTGLRYWSQTAAPMARLDRAIRQLQRRLAEAGDDVNDWDLEYFPRPKWMRRHTHARLIERGLALVEERDAVWFRGAARLLSRFGWPETPG